MSEQYQRRSPLATLPQLYSSLHHRGRSSVVERQLPKLKRFPVTKAMVYRNLDKTDLKIAKATTHPVHPSRASDLKFANIYRNDAAQFRTYLDFLYK